MRREWGETLMATFPANRVRIFDDSESRSVGIEEIEGSLAFELAVYSTERKTGTEWQPE